MKLHVYTLEQTLAQFNKRFIGCQISLTVKTWQVSPGPARAGKKPVKATNNRYVLSVALQPIIQDILQPGCIG
jgi:hypothetical protein